MWRFSVATTKDRSDNKEFEMAKIIDVEGIGPKYAEKLVKAGITTTGKLLKKRRNPKKAVRKLKK